MAEIRILNGNNHRLRALLGEELASKVNIRKGDAVLTCDPEVETDKAVGRAIFEKLLTQGHTAYEVKEAGENEQISEWNPVNQAVVVMVGPIVGG